MKPVNRLNPSHPDDLVPETSIDHLLPEAEWRAAATARAAIESLGEAMGRSADRAALYPVFYDSARQQLAAGVSHEDIRAEMMMLADADDPPFTSALCEAYEDALAGRPPRHEA